MSDWKPIRLALAVSWFLLPFVSGPVLGDALADASGSIPRVATIALWGLWTVGLLAILLPHPVSLTAIRFLSTAAVPIGIWAVAAAEVNALAIIALTVMIVAAGVALLPQVAAMFVDGQSYGDERRLPLRPPRAVLFGPLPVAWFLAVVGLATGPLLLASSRWILGVVLTVVGVPLAVLALRSLHTLSRRFLVFVPAGFVVHDLTALTDPILFRREDIQIVGPAFTDSVAHDLSLGASGLALEARFTRPLAVPLRVRSSGVNSTPATETKDLRAVLFSPSQPGVVLAEAERRRIPVG